MKRLSIGLLLLMMIGQAAAADYYSWYVSPGVFAQSVAEGCQWYEVNKLQSSTHTFKYDPSASYFDGPNYYRCIFKGTPKFENLLPKTSSMALNRFGDSCPAGQTYNGTTGACDCPGEQIKDGESCTAPPSCEAGQDLLTRGADAPATIVSGRVYILSSPPSTVCSAGCQYISTTSKAASCYLVSGSSDTGFCNYTVTSDGERCSGEDAPGPDVGDPPNPEVPPDSPTQPTDPDDPGCPEGQSWSGDACVAEPTGEGDEGSSDEGEEGEDGDSGDPCDIDGDCWEEGDGGSGSDSGSGSGSGTGNGDNEGSDDGDAEDDGEGECDPSKGYVCGGGKGPESGLNAPDAGNWDKANEEWDQRLDDAKKELKDKVKANVDQMKSAFNLQLSAGGGQLPCDSISVWGKSYRFCVADYGEQLINLRLALLLMAAVIAALIVLKE